MKTGSFYSATDKALFDALCQHKITRNDMTDLMFSRGVIVSAKTEKEDLARDFSSFFHGYEDYEKLASVLGVSSRREKSTSYNLNTTHTIETVEEVLTQIKTTLNDNGDQADHKITNSGNRIEISVSYQECNFSKSEMQQVSNKDAVIIIEERDGGLEVRSPSNTKMEEVNGIIIDKLEEHDPNMKREDIQLSSVSSPKIRSDFFQRLISTLPGYKLDTVTDVFVFNPLHSGSSEQENEVHITSASLKGKGVTLSSEIKALYAKGFYIWKIVWRAVKQNDENSDIYEFEAQFSNPEEFKQFSYIVKGSLKKKESSEQHEPSHNSKRTHVTRYEEDKLSNLIVHTAQKTIESIFEELKEVTVDENTEKQVVSA